MPQDPNSQSAEAERAELAGAVEALAKWPRLSRLLQYMGEKVLSGESDDLNECHVATEVLGSSKNVFNAAEDAIARVETHRLRKRLGEFYATEGKDHPVQVTLPSGTYVPHFSRKPARDPFPALPHPEWSPEAESQAEAALSRPWLVFRWQYLALATILAVSVLAVFLYVRPKLSTRMAHSLHG